MTYITRKAASHKFISSPEKWLKDIMSLKRKKPDGEWELGFLRRDWFQDKWQTVLIVYKISIFKLKIPVHWNSLPQQQYANVDMMLKDGWLVD